LSREHQHARVQGAFHGTQPENVVANREQLVGHELGQKSCGRIGQWPDKKVEDGRQGQVATQSAHHFHVQCAHRIV